MKINLEELFESVSLFKDESKLFPEYIPLNLPHREKQIEMLASYFKGLLKRDEFAFYKVICYGPTGTGKTAVAKYFGKLLAKKSKELNVNLHFVHINCYIERTYFMIVKKLVESLLPQIPKRGFSPQQLLKWFLEYIEEENKKLLICLDEVDYIIRSEPEILYSLTRISEIYENKKNRISLLLILRDISILYRLDERILSILQKNLIKFEPYTSAQLITILKERVEEAFFPSVIDNSIIEMIAKKVGIDFNGKGDARYALEVLWKATKIAEIEKSKKVNPEHVRKAFSEIYPGLNLEIITSLGKHEKLLLKAIANSFKKTKEIQINMGKIKNEYSILCEEYKEEARKHTQLWSYLKSLQNKGLINIQIKRAGKGRSSYISLDIPIEIIEKNIEII